jgi:hypothetical protein
MRFMIRVLIVGMILGCAGKVSAATPSPEGQRPASKSFPSKAAEPGSPGVTLGPLTGTVLETIDAAGYTYLRLKTPKGEIWAAVTKATVKKGSEVTVVNPIPMDGFESKTLNRKFDRIVFGSLDTGTNPATTPLPLAAGHETSTDKQAAMAAQHAAAANAPVEAGKIKVKKAEGAEGKTVSEIYARKDSLKGASVAVRGKVVKYNAGIMGKNWIHLRDGSGSREKKDDDITVRTSDSAAVGMVIVVRGIVRVDRDFGSGYAYPVIIEDAQVSK